MNRALALVTLIATLPIAATAAAHGALPEPFTVVYDVQYSRATVAETTFSLETPNEAGLHRLSSVTEPRGLAALIRYGDVVEVSQFQIDGMRLVPIDYRFNDGTRKGKRNSSIYFDWPHASAQSMYKGVDANHTLIGNESDRMLLQLQVMADMEADQLAEAYRIIDRNEIKQYNFVTLGEEVLSTPAGQFKTTKLRRQRPGSSRETLIWASNEHHFVPIKMIQTIDERPNVVLTATSLSFAAAAEPEAEEEPAEEPEEETEQEPNEEPAQ